MTCKISKSLAIFAILNSHLEFVIDLTGEDEDQSILKPNVVGSSIINARHVINTTN